MMLRTKVKKLHPDAVLPVYAKPGDAGFDLASVEHVVIEPGETKVIKTGLAFEIPPGYELQVRPRSGVSRKTNLLVVLGTVDSGYRGEVGVIVKNMEPFIDATGDVIKHIDGYEEPLCGEAEIGSYVILKGDRIAQGVIAPVETACFVEVDELSDSERGSGGFGSTGVK
jgi:dUTP pyrophosphatase